MKKREAEKDAQISYREAMDELERLVARIEDSTTNIEEIAPMVKRSVELTEICRKELRRYKDEIDKLQESINGRS